MDWTTEEETTGKAPLSINMLVCRWYGLDSLQPEVWPEDDDDPEADEPETQRKIKPMKLYNPASYVPLGAQTSEVKQTTAATEAADLTDPLALDETAYR
jgi:hypothetical protein